MAKEPQDREDLLRDGTQFVRRLEIEVRTATVRDTDQPTIVFCGFRENGALSVYWGQDTVIQFNASGQLRRAFWRDRMVATYKHQLHWLKSEGEGRVRLKRIPFSANESQEFDRVAKRVLEDLDTELNAASRGADANLRGQFPEGADVVAEVCAWLAARNLAELGIQYAMHPGVGKKVGS